MNTLNRMLMVIASFALVGCGSMPMQSADYQRCDSARMERIERAATQRGVNVIWVNCPAHKDLKTS